MTRTSLLNVTHSISIFRKGLQELETCQPLAWGEGAVGGSHTSLSPLQYPAHLSVFGQGQDMIIVPQNTDLLDKRQVHAIAPQGAIWTEDTPSSVIHL